MRKSSVTRRILNAMLGTKQQKTSQDKVIKQKRRLLMESLEDRRVFAGITEGNIVVYRVGDGAAGLSNTGAAVFLDEYTPTGTLVQTIAMPTTVSGGNRQLIASGTASSEGMLNFSTNNQQLVLTGYGRDLGGAGSISGTTSALVNRIVGVVDAATGSINTTTALTDAASANNIRSVAADGAGNLWVTGGAGGIRQAVVGGTTSTQLSTAVTNLRNAEIFGGQLFVSASSGTTRLATVGAGLPTTSGQAITNLPGFPTAGSPYGYYFADLDAGVAGLDTLYVASDDAGALTKYSLVGGSWTANGTIGVAGDAYRGLDAHVIGNRVTLFATRRGGTAAAGGGELVTIVDTSGYNGAFAGTPAILSTAAANTAYRGVAFRGAADYPPVISPITDKLSPTGVPKSIDFTLFDLDTDLSTFSNTTSFTLTSSNQALVKNSSLSVIGSGADRTLKIVPEAGASGDVTISMVVTDSSGNSTTETFVLSLLDSRLTVSIDLDPTTDGIQSTGEFKKGDVVTANVVMTLTGAASLSSYGYSVRFDTDEVDFVSRTETPPPGMDEADNQNFSDDNAGNGAPFGNFGWLRRFDAITLGNGPIAPGTFVVATLNFNVVNLGGGANDVDIMAGRFEDGVDDFFDNDGNDLTAFGLVSFESANISFVNTDPTISDIPNTTINQDTSTGEIAFTVDDLEQAAGVLVVSATSSNPTLVPNANIVLGGTGTDRTIAVTPAAGQSGTTTITVTVSDGISTSSDTFDLIVNPVGGLVDPVITITSGNKVYDGAGYVPTTTVGGSAGDVASPALTYTYFVGAGTGGTNLGATAPIDVGTYTVVASFAGNASYNPGTAQKTFDITPATVTVASATASNKVYDTTTAATVTAIVLNGVIASDVANVSAGGVGAFVDKNVGTGKTVNVTNIALSGTRAFNYVLSGNTASTTADITAASLVASITAADKVYDTTTAASITVSLSGVLGSDVVTVSGTGTFADKNVGVGKTVTSTDIAIAGADAGNYTVNSSDTDTADITAAALVASITASDKVYDTTTAATIAVTLSGVLGSDVVNASGTGTFADKNVGVGKTVTSNDIVLSGADAGNYTVNSSDTDTADITAAALVASITAADKVYDTTTAASITVSLSGVLGSDVVTVSGTGTFADKNVGIGKTVTSTDIAIAGADAGNYTVNSSDTDTADITAAVLVASITAADKVYDATTAASITVGLSGVLGSDVVTVSGTGTFANKNVGVGKTVTSSNIALGGADAANYTVNTTATDTADITALAIVGSITANDKAFDGTTTATIATRTLAGVIPGDDVSYVGGTANFDTPDVGNNKPVTATGLSLSGADAGNYTVNSSANTTASILAVPTVVDVNLNGAAGTDARIASAQRSLLVNIEVVFSEPVTLAAGAFVLRNLTDGVDLGESQIIISPSSGASDRFVITFGAGSSVETRGAAGGGNSLANGNYQLTVKADKVTGAASANMIGDFNFGAAQSDNFFRLYGDTDGDADVDARDLQAFRRAYLNNSTAYDPLVDFNGNGAVQSDTADFNAFRTAYLFRNRRR